MISKEDLTLLSAYADEELDGKRRSELQQRLLREPEIRKELEAIRAIDEHLRNYAGAIDSAPLPETIRSLVRVSPGSLALKLLAAAASVFVLTIGAYLLILQPSRSHYSQLAILESGQRLEFDTGTYLEILASFRRHDGHYCREFVTKARHEVACLTDVGWQSVISLRRQEMPDGTYRPAGADLAAIDFYIVENMDGNVLSASEEHSLITNGWQ